MLLGAPIPPAQSVEVPAIGLLAFVTWYGFKHHHHKFGTYLLGFVSAGFLMSVGGNGSNIANTIVTTIMAVFIALVAAGANAVKSVAGYIHVAFLIYRRKP